MSRGSDVRMFPLEKVVVVVFVVAHMQDLAPILAPVSVLLLIAVHPRSHRFRSGPMPLLVAGLLAYLTVTSAVNGTLSSDVSEYLRRHGSLFYSLLLFLVFLRMGCDKRLVGYLLRAGFAVCSVLTLFYCICLATHADISVLGQPVISNRDLALGLLNGRNPTAGVAGVFGIVGLSHLLQRRTLLGSPAVTGLLAAVLLFAPFYMRSRGYALAVPPAAAVTVLMSRGASASAVLKRSRLPAFALIFVIGTVGWLQISDRFTEDIAADPNVATRIELWERGLARWQMSPFIGFGIGSFQQVDFVASDALPFVGLRVEGRYVEEVIRFDPEGGLHAHNLYIQLLAEAGLVGTGWFFAIFGTAWGRDEDRGAVMSQAFAGVFVYLAGAGLVAGLTMTSPTISWPLFLLAAATASSRMSAAGGSERSSPPRRWGPRAPLVSQPVAVGG